MKCSEFGEVAPDLGRRGAVSPEMSAAALAHAESCSRCAALLTETESLEFALRKLAARGAESQPPARVEKALLDEFRRTRKIPASRSVRWRFAAIAAAAAILFVLGISLRHRFVQSPPSERTANLASTSRQASSTAVVPSESHAVEPALNPAASATSAAKAASPLKAAESQMDQAFVTLPYADDPEDLEGGAIVRVNLSRAALASFGLPVSDAGDPELIPADIIVSADGTPQAVRLVSQVLPAENISEK